MAIHAHVCCQERTKRLCGCYIFKNSKSPVARSEQWRCEDTQTFAMLKMVPIADKCMCQRVPQKSITLYSFWDSWCSYARQSLAVAHNRTHYVCPSYCCPSSTTRKKIVQLSQGILELKFAFLSLFLNPLTGNWCHPCGQERLRGILTGMGVENGITDLPQSVA